MTCSTHIRSKITGRSDQTMGAGLEAIRAPDAGVAPKGNRSHGRTLHRYSRCGTRIVSPDGRIVATESAGAPEIAPPQKQIGQLTQAGRFNSASRHRIEADIRDRFESSATDNPRLRPRPVVVPSDNRAPTERKQAAGISARRRRTISTRRRRRTISAGRRRRTIIVRRRRIISRRRRVVTRRRAVGDGAADNCASGEAAENAGADSAAVTAGICRSRSGQSGKANARSADKRNERLMHKFSP